jgi:dTDP-4-amino-4,6-dideoxygalactose transaminase
MNELTGAVLLAQFRKIDRILQRLRYLKTRFKDQIKDTPGVTFRKLNDAAGECNTLLTVMFPSRGMAQSVASKLGTTTVSMSGWHVYNNMEQILGKRMPTDHGCPFQCSSYPCAQEYQKGMLPRTDQLLERTINLSVGIVDPGLGASFGIHSLSTDDEVDQRAKEFITAVDLSLHEKSVSEGEPT